jgi:trans-aconitate methyltransferase
MIDTRTAAQWVRRWDRQQEHYADHRESCFAVLIDLLEETVGVHEQPVVIDVGAGPGSLAARVVRHLPHARVVAIENDPFLVQLGQAWLGGTVDFVRDFAGSQGWRARVDVPKAHAVVASSALHDMTVPHLRQLYADVLDWLTTDGILINVDHFNGMDSSSSHPDPSGRSPWNEWWRQAYAAPELAPLSSTRREVAEVGDAAAGGNGLSADQHLALLDAVGFGHTQVAWHRARSTVLVARPQPGSPVAAT